MIKNENYIPIHYDLMFKFLFGTKENINYTIDLLSSLLNIDKSAFDYSSIINSVKLNMHNIKSKRFELDIKLVTANKDATYVLEMQKIYNKDSEIKNFMYVAYHFSTQLRSGERYKNTKSVTGIEFIKKFEPSEEHEIIRKYKMVNIKDPSDVIADNLFNIILVDVEQKRELGYNNNRFELWRQFIGADTLEEAEKIAEKDPIIKSALEEALKFMNDDFVLEYFSKERLISSQMESMKEDGLQEGLEVGRQEGLEEGQFKEKYEIAKNFLKNTDIPLEQISLCTGLSLEELEKLKENI